METVKKEFSVLRRIPMEFRYYMYRARAPSDTGGELHNSSSSSMEFMEKEVWPYIRQFKMNTVILPVAWESIEAREGCF